MKDITDAKFIVWTYWSYAGWAPKGFNTLEEAKEHQSNHIVQDLFSIITNGAIAVNSSAEAERGVK